MKEIVAGAENHLEYNMEQIKEQIKDIMAKSFMIDRSRLTDDAELAKDLGVDSLAVFDMVITLEDTLKIELQEKELLKFTRVGEAVEALAELVKEQLN